jgi:hypothetical protein
MLQTLEKLDRSRVASVLSLAAREFLPRARDDHHTPNLADQDAAAELIRELSAKARRPQAEVDTIATQEALSREISSYLLSGVDLAEVRARVGDKGALSPSLYKVTFSPKFEASKAFWGLSAKYILNAITNCDQVQHLVSGIEAPNAPPHSSLFTQIPPVKHHPLYTILVKCQRVADMLIVDEAYRIYHDEVDLVGAALPLDILKRFIEKFGEEVETIILNADGTNAQIPQRAKMFHEVIFNVPRGGLVVQNFPNGHTVRLGPSPVDGPWELALCFAIGNQRYADQLIRHGIKVEFPKEQVGAYTVRNVPRP